MSKIRLHGSSSGYTEIAPVAASGNNTLTLPNDGTIISKDSAGAIGVTSVHTTKLVSTGTINSDGGAITSKASGVPVVLNSTNDNDFKISFQNSGSTVSFIGGSSSNFFRVGNASASSVLDVDSSSNLKFNSGYGSVATAFGVRAWANFNGSGTVASDFNGGGVTSMVDLGEGQYRVNFSTAMPDTNYCMVEGCSNGSTSPRIACQQDKTTALYEFKTRTDANSLNDAQYGQIAFIR